MNWYVQLHNAIQAKAISPTQPSSLKEFEEVRQYATHRSDINEHLPLLFAETVRMRPRLIVELGVRSGVSTFAFSRAAKYTNATLLSIDIEDCVHASDYPDWHFIHEDDIQFAKRFPNWCTENSIEPIIDVLFIDTSHYYQHTVQEIERWFPFLAAHAIVFFHDTNIKEISRRRDGSVGRGWSNDRGVIRAIEKYFDKKFDETKDFIDVEPGWIIRHYSNNSGMTMLEKLPFSS